MNTKEPTPRLPEVIRTRAVMAYMKTRLPWPPGADLVPSGQLSRPLRYHRYQCTSEASQRLLAEGSA